jgi:hypothetical protein
LVSARSESGGTATTSSASLLARLGSWFGPETSAWLVIRLEAAAWSTETVTEKRLVAPLARPPVVQVRTGSAEVSQPALSET